MTEGAFHLSKEQTDLRDLARDVARDRYAPYAQKWDKDGTHFPKAERKWLSAQGLLGVTLPEEFGGGGRPLIDGLIVIEEIAKVCQLAAFPVFEACVGAARVVELLGTDDQKHRLLPSVAGGGETIAVAISEAEAGSAATDMRTTATIDADGALLNGSKRWCSGAGYAEQYLVYAQLGQSARASDIGAFLVGHDAPGVTFGLEERLMGFHGIPSADIYLDQVRVPAEDQIPSPGGFGSLFSVFAIERIGNATMSLALGQGALDRTVAYVQQRQQFGRPLVEFQMVQAMLAEMIMQVDAARLVVYRAALNAPHGIPAPLEASVAKCFANDMAKKVTEAAVELHGGYGYSEEFEVERFHRDAHGWAVGGGTANMQKIRITSEYLGRRFSQRHG